MSSRDKARMPFELPLPTQKPLKRTLVKVVKKPAETVFGLKQLNAVYSDLPSMGGAHEFFTRALERLGVRYTVTTSDRNRIPHNGPVVVLANHPFGAIEGVVLASLMTSIRSDIKFMANYLLGRIPEMRPLLIDVDPFGSRDAASRNFRPLRQAIEHVRNGGMLLVFPSGEVAHRSWKRKAVTDPAWSPTVARIIRKTGAPVLPLYFGGHNGRLFQWAGLLHKSLRTMMLPRELLNKNNSTVNVKVGTLIGPKKLAEIDDDRALIEYARMRTYVLADRTESLSRPKTHPAVVVPPSDTLPDIIPSPGADIIEREIRDLPDSAQMAHSGDMVVYCAKAGDIPQTLTEIGRLREITFRAVGEGTGRPFDLDRYDQYYHHLFIWNRADREIVGSYRLGRSDQIVEEHGVKGLYTRSLYSFKQSMLDRIRPALELGRSFVQPRYQREFAPLHLLWKGLGQYVSRYRQYRYLFGPVSISNRYQSMSVRLIHDFLRQHSFAEDLATCIKPTKPYRTKRLSDWDAEVTGRLLSDVDEISSLVAEIQSDRQGVPVLLRHYLRLGGRVLAFNIDDQFSDVVDALLIVDLMQTEQRILTRYLGKTEAIAFREYHERLGESK
ncbi:MAG: GNAT family N-acetyltransferase [candidate division Zixibacteria bacterium]|nr:GNAT family N-acetyltransferase [candidate division Zixibacteria bacterium]